VAEVPTILNRDRYQHDGALADGALAEASFQNEPSLRIPDEIKQQRLCMFSSVTQESRILC